MRRQTGETPPSTSQFCSAKCARKCVGFNIIIFSKTKRADNCQVLMLMVTLW